MLTKVEEFPLERLERQEVRPVVARIQALSRTPLETRTEIVKEATQLFQTIPYEARTRMAYAALIELEVKVLAYGFYSRITDLMKQMQTGGIHPSTVIYNRVLRAAIHTGDPDEMLRQKKKMGVLKFRLSRGNYLWLIHVMRRLKKEGLERRLYKEMCLIYGRLNHRVWRKEMIRIEREEALSRKKVLVEEQKKKFRDGGQVGALKLAVIEGRYEDLIRLIGGGPMDRELYPLVIFAAKAAEDYPHVIRLYEEMDEKKIKTEGVVSPVIDAFVALEKLDEAGVLFRKYFIARWLKGSLDCHGLSYGVAAIQLTLHLRERSPDRCVVITGKGLHSERLGVMREKIAQHVSKHHPEYRVIRNRKNAGELKLHR